MGREIWVRCGIWRSLGGWYRRSVFIFGKAFVEVLCDRFPIQQPGSRYSIVVGQNDTQCFLHRRVSKCNEMPVRCYLLQDKNHYQIYASSF